MGIQQVIWRDETLKAEVYNLKGEFVREIQYERSAYKACKQLYFNSGGKSEDEICIKKN